MTGPGAPAGAVGDAAKPALVLEDLPPEIIALILDFLLPQPPEIGETRPVGYRQLMVEEPWFDFTRCRRGLHSLCRVSRRMSEMARPLLYRVVAIWNERSMLLFLRTLYNKPHYGLWTRYLSCHITLTRESVIREFRQLLTLHLPGFEPAPVTSVLTSAARDFIHMLGQFLPHMVVSEGDLDHVPQALLCFILMYLTKLETLLLQVPISDDHQEYDVFCSQVAQIKALFDSEPYAAPFQNIHTLLLQGDPELLAHFEEDDCDCEIPEVWGAQPRRYALLFASLPKLSTLEVSSDDGVWCCLPDEHRSSHETSGDDPPPPFLANIRHIFLHDSAAYPSDMYHLLRNAPQLESLYLASRLDDDPLREPVEDDSANAHPEALDIALSQHAKHLRALDVSWQDLHGFESLVGPDGRLTSLAHMGELTSLCVQMALLYGSPPAAVPGESAPLVDLLPPNLVDLTLEDWWWTNAAQLRDMPDWTLEDNVRHYQAQHDYRVAALRTLTQFARDVRTRLRRLKKVVLLCRIPWTWVLEGAVELDFHFEHVKSLFLEQGVQFSVTSDEV
ncbi:714e42be-b691-4a69-a2d7-56a34fbf0027 [Thermothielavioides terrestris]|uniref:714e42be-b691-4a69-a2d7-56a34fbf0027 n=1 Tax=Thermothielavioides terrestris TaxID=2587410 RepID=A0A446BKJ9_9PEZI|nr:714e42be-b691-4a69-a2d7-56a34fbf0027 [Thermothielavioides terrestris]